MAQPEARRQERRWFAAAMAKLAPEAAKRWASTHSEATRGFYERLGFEDVGVELRQRLD